MASARVWRIDALGNRFLFRARAGVLAQMNRCFPGLKAIDDGDVDPV